MSVNLANIKWKVMFHAIKTLLTWKHTPQLKKGNNHNRDTDIKTLLTWKHTPQIKKGNNHNRDTVCNRQGPKTNNRHLIHQHPNNMSNRNLCMLTTHLLTPLKLCQGFNLALRFHLLQIKMSNWKQSLKARKNDVITIYIYTYMYTGWVKRRVTVNVKCLSVNCNPTIGPPCTIRMLLKTSQHWNICFLLNFLSKFSLSRRINLIYEIITIIYIYI